MRIAEIAALPKYDTKARQAATKFAALALSDRQRKAVEWYRGHGHTHVNSHLRGTEPEWEMPSDEEMWADYGFAMTVEEAIQHLDSIADTAPPRKRPLKVFRGERNATRMAALMAMEVGQSYTDPGYLSTSLGASYAFYGFSQYQSSNALSMIIVPPSVRGAYVSNIDGGDDHTEIEFLIDRGTTYTLREKRVIPSRNRGHPVKEVTLLVWAASR